MLFKVKADLTALRAQVQADIDAQVANARALFVTLTPGQEAVYALKRDEAFKIVSDPEQGTNVAAGETPHITAEAEDDGVSRFDKAVEILTRDHEWAIASQMIERVRRQANAALAEAATAPEIRSTSALDWSQIHAFSGQLLK